MTEWHFFDKVYRVWVVFLIGDHKEFVSFMDRSGYKDIKDLEERDSSGMCIQSL